MFWQHAKILFPNIAINDFNIHSRFLPEPNNHWMWQNGNWLIFWFPSLFSWYSFVKKSFTSGDKLQILLWRQDKVIILSLYLLIFRGRSCCECYIQWRQICISFFQYSFLLFSYLCARCVPSPALLCPDAVLSSPLAPASSTTGLRVGPAYRRGCWGPGEGWAEEVVTPGCASLLHLCLSQERWPLLWLQLPQGVSPPSTVSACTRHSV